MKNSYELLNSDLLKKRDYLNKIDYWLSVMNRTQGWHYDLDIIWLIKNLKKYNINEGSTILDALSWTWDYSIYININGIQYHKFRFFKKRNSSII